MSEIRSKLEGVDWSSVYSINSVNESYDTFSSLLTSANSISFPLKPACSESRRSSNPGSQKLSLHLVRGKIFLQTVLVKPNCTQQVEIYNKYRNKYNFLARKKYFHNKLSLHSLYKFYVSCFIFSHFNCLLPASLSSLLHFNHDFPLTRSHFNLLKMFLVRYQFAITGSYQASIIWNEIPLSIRNSLTTTNFKKELKLYFLSLNRISTGFS